MSKKRERKQPAPTSTARDSGLVDRTSSRLRAAHRLWRQGRLSDAAALFDAAMRLEPNNVQSYVVAARAYGDRYQFERMEQTLDRLIRRAPRHPGVHHYVGETYAGLKLPERALAAYQRAAELPGAGPPTWMELAALYERAHRLDEAEEMIERAIAAGYRLPLVWLVRGRIQRRINRLAEAEAAFHRTIEQSSPGSDWCCEAWGELALMRDAAGDYRGALEAIEQCKAAQRLREGPFLAVATKGREVMSALVEATSGADFQRWQGDARHLPRQPFGLLTGFPRSGTTLLEQVLDAHPRLVSSEERDFIGNELIRSWTFNRPSKPLFEVVDELESLQLAQDRQRYLQGISYLLGESIGDRVLLDKNPAYNLTIPIVLRLFPEARLIVAFRDPRDVVLSCYLRYLPLNAVSVEFLDVMRTAQRYAFDMSAWLKFRDEIESPWCEIRYEDVVEDVAEHSRRALATLGLPWDEGVLGYRERLSAKKRVTSPSYEAVAQPIYASARGRWRHYEQLLAPVLPILEPLIRELGYS